MGQNEDNGVHWDGSPEIRIPKKHRGPTGDKEKVTIYLEKSLIKAVDDLAVALHRTRSNMMGRMLSEALGMADRSLDKVDELFSGLSDK